ncbi:molybdenum cofactor guanylyltransferase [Bacillus sp. JCM 19034]|uniref:molybdenum cofactor guanylyltransferase n=1 Tax=Bacillus sp. JCM 19034 TaxID=1481928 RepID=UPI0007817697|nr:molybdenum cofactor guanylyltransferase [Bacillus sp. JCM 19034]
MDVNGLILAGGKSSRYGKAKMFEYYKGKPFYQHSIDAFKKGGVQTVTIVTNAKLAKRFHIKDEHTSLFIEDIPFQGPLYALYNAMTVYNEAKWFFILPADTPFVTAAFVRRLLSYRKKEPSILLPVSKEYDQPLHSLYPISCLPIIKRLVLMEQRSMKPLLEQFPVQRISFDCTYRDFVNMNTQAEWSEYNNE